MGKLYREFFYVPKYGKISEKTMTIRVALSAFVVVTCLIVLSLSTYAWFSMGVNSGSNAIKAAAFDLTVSVVSAEPEQGAYKLENGEYSVLLTKTGNAKTGFCVVEITVDETKTTLHTQQLGKDGDLERGELTFTLHVSGLTEAATVNFAAHWGTSSYYGGNDNSRYIENASIINVTAEGVLFATGNSHEEEETSQTPSNGEQTELIHTVAEGENLTWIAKDYKTTPEAIAEYNGLKDVGVIQIGQQLKIPLADGALSEDTTEATTTPTEATDPTDTTPEETDPADTTPEETDPTDAADSAS